MSKDNNANINNIGITTTTTTTIIIITAIANVKFYNNNK